MLQICRFFQGLLEGALSFILLLIYHIGAVFLLFFIYIVLPVVFLSLLHQKISSFACFNYASRHISMYHDDIAPYLETAVELKKRDHAVMGGDMTAAQIDERNAAIDRCVLRIEAFRTYLNNRIPESDESITKCHHCSTMKEHLEEWFKKLDKEPQGITADMINDLNFEDWTPPSLVPDDDSGELGDEKVVGDLMV